MVRSVATLMTAGPDPAPRPDRRHKYVIIREWLGQQIVDGKFACGEQIPSEHDIMARFGVSRVTARQAFNELRSAGLIEARRGKGYFVSRFTKTTSLERLLGFGEMMRPLGLTTTSDVLEIVEVQAPPSVSLALKLPEDELVIRIVRTRHAAGNVVALSENYFPANLGQRLMRLNLMREDLYTLMETRLGIDLSFADAELQVTPVDPHHARYLKVPPDALAMRVTRVLFDSAGRPLAHEIDYFALETIKFQIRIPRW